MEVPFFLFLSSYIMLAYSADGVADLIITLLHKMLSYVSAQNVLVKEVPQNDYCFDLNLNAQSTFQIRVRMKQD